MSLTVVSLEEVRKSIGEQFGASVASLTQEEKDFIQEKFKVEKYHNSETEFLIMYRFQILESERNQTICRSLINKGLAHYCEYSGVSIQSIPSFFKK